MNCQKFCGNSNCANVEKVIKKNLEKYSNISGSLNKISNSYKNNEINEEEIILDDVYYDYPSKFNKSNKKILEKHKK